MKSKLAIRTFILSSGLLASINLANAADFFWDGTPGTANNASNGGAGTWDTSTANWDNGAYNTWNNAGNDTAIFGGTSASVNLGTNITAGGLTLANGYSINSGIGPFTLTLGTGDVNVNSGTATINAVVAGTNGITKTGNGTLRLDALNTFTGDTIISGGTLQVGNNNTAATLGSAIYSGNIQINGTQLLLTGNQNQTFSGVISGSGVFNRGGSNTITLTGANTYTGQTRILGSGAGGPGLSVSSFNSVVDNSSALMASSSLGAPTNDADGTILFGNSGNQRSSTLTYTGSGESTNRIMAVGFNNSSNHRLVAEGSGLLEFTSAFVINKSSGRSNSALRLGGDGDGSISAGFINDEIPGILIKEGAGTWTIGGSVTSNSVAINSGTLIVNGTMSTVINTQGTPTPAGDVTVAAGATLGGNATINTNLIVNGNLSVGNSPGQMFVDSLTLGSTALTTMELGGFTLGTEYDNLTVASNGLLTLGGDLDIVNFGGFDLDSASFTYDLFSISGTTSPTGAFDSVDVNGVSLINTGGVWTGVNGIAEYSFDQSTGNFTVAIPEPSTSALIGLGGLALILRRRR